MGLHGFILTRPIGLNRPSMQLLATLMIVIMFTFHIGTWNTDGLNSLNFNQQNEYKGDHL